MHVASRELFIVHGVYMNYGAKIQWHAKIEKFLGPRKRDILIHFVKTPRFLEKQEFLLRSCIHFYNSSENKCTVSYNKVSRGILSRFYDFEHLKLVFIYFLYLKVRKKQLCLIIRKVTIMV